MASDPPIFLPVAPLTSTDIRVDSSTMDLPPAVVQRLQQIHLHVTHFLIDNPDSIRVRTYAAVLVTVLITD